MSDPTPLRLFNPEAPDAQSPALPTSGDSLKQSLEAMLDLHRQQMDAIHNATELAALSLKNIVRDHTV